jgi:hypothetical protein
MFHDQTSFRPRENYLIGLETGLFGLGTHFFHHETYLVGEKTKFFQRRTCLICGGTCLVHQQTYLTRKGTSKIGAGTYRVGFETGLVWLTWIFTGIKKLASAMLKCFQEPESRIMVMRRGVRNFREGGRK